MFDNLRDLSDSSFYEEEQNDPYQESVAAPAAAPVARSKSAAAPKRKSRGKSSNFLGMTAQQRFILSLMLMFTVLIMGTLAMFVLGKMSIF